MRKTPSGIQKSLFHTVSNEKDFSLIDFSINLLYTLKVSMVNATLEIVYQRPMANIFNCRVSLADKHK